MSEPAHSMRLDIWLWAARFYKTRSLAKQAIEGGKIEVNDESAKPAKAIHAGDRLRISRGEERILIGVAALSDKRGPAGTAQSLYVETAESIATRERERDMRRLTGAALSHPLKRPNKKSRRLLRGFKEGLV